MNPKSPDSGWSERVPTALLVLADRTVLEGFGFGATGHAVGEVCFNTAMTGSRRTSRPSTWRRRRARAA